MYNSVKRAAKKMHYDGLFDEHRNDISATWKILNGLIKRNKHGDNRIDKLKIDGVDISDPKMVSNAFADFFANVGPKKAELIATQMRSAGATPTPLLSFSVSEQNANTIFLHPVIGLLRHVTGSVCSIERRPYWLAEKLCPPAQLIYKDGRVMLCCRVR